MENKKMWATKYEDIPQGRMHQRDGGGGLLSWGCRIIGYALTKCGEFAIGINR